VPPIIKDLRLGVEVLTTERNGRWMEREMMMMVVIMAMVVKKMMLRAACCKRGLTLFATRAVAGINPLYTGRAFLLCSCAYCVDAPVQMFIVCMCRLVPGGVVV